MSFNNAIENISAKVQELSTKDAYHRMVDVREIMKTDDFLSLMKFKKEFQEKVEQLNTSIALIDSVSEQAVSTEKKAVAEVVKFATQSLSSPEEKKEEKEEFPTLSKVVKNTSAVQVPKKPLREVSNWKNAGSTKKPALEVSPKQVIEKKDGVDYLNVGTLLYREDRKLWNILQNLLVNKENNYMATCLPVVMKKGSNLSTGKLIRCDPCRAGSSCNNRNCNFYHPDDPLERFFPTMFANLVKNENGFTGFENGSKEYVLNRVIAVILLGIYNQSSKSSMEVF